MNFQAIAARVRFDFRQRDPRFAYRAAIIRHEAEGNIVHTHVFPCLPDNAADRDTNNAALATRWSLYQIDHASPVHLAAL
jgi:hypothetical protein